MVETVGLQLKQAREAKSLTIQKVVQATHIRAHQIEALEADDFDSLPSPIQARAFLRLYAEFLGLSLEEVISRQQVEVFDSFAKPIILPTKNDQKSPPTISSEINPAQLKIQSVGGKINRSIKRFNLIPKKQGEQPSQLIYTEKVAEPNERDIRNEADNQESPGPIQVTLPSQEIFISIGKTLQQRRESLSLTLEEVERHTHVRMHYLSALEVGSISSLPSSVQARGMLSNYAHFLNLDIDEILLAFADGLQAQLLERQAHSSQEFNNSSSKYTNINHLPFRFNIPNFLKRYISIDIIVGGGLVVLLLIFAIWGTSRIINLRTGSTPQPTAPPMLNFLIPTSVQLSSTPEPSLTGNSTSPGGVVAVETFSGTLPAAGNGPVQVVVIAQNSAYVRVTVDGKVEFEGRVTAGTVYSYDGNLQIEVLTGNGRAISILYNQNTLGPMGDIGQVVDRIYTANAILNPTATFTPTPSITPTPTSTIRPTTTPRPSSTPRLNPTLHPSQTPEN